MKKAVPSARLVRLLDVDPDLAMRLPPEAATEARTSLVVRAVSVDPGSLPLEGLVAADAPGLGLLVLEGLFARDVLVAGTVSTELVGAGDLVQPANVDDDEPLVPSDVTWTALSNARVAILEDRVVAVAARWPQLISALFDRAARRTSRLAIQAAIRQLKRVDSRILVLLWHLAGRWGRVTANGMVLPLGLSHASLGRLVGARRPTVTTALGSLGERGLVTRRSDGGWLLTGDPPAELRQLETASTWTGSARARMVDRRVTVSHQPTPAARNLERRLLTLRGVYDRETWRLVVARERSLALREESNRLRRELRARRVGP